MTNNRIKTYFFVVCSVLLSLCFSFALNYNTIITANADNNDLTQYELIDISNAQKIFYTNDLIYGVDTINQQIFIYDLETKQIAKYGGPYDASTTETTFLSIKGATVTSDNLMFVYEQNNGFREYDSDFSLVFSHQVASGSYIGNIADMITTSSNIVYALDYTHNTLLKGEYNSQLEKPRYEFEIELTFDIDLNASSQILLSFDGETIFIYNDNSIYQIIDNQTQKIYDFTQQDYTISCVQIDYLNNLYLLASNSTASTLFKYSLSASATTQLELQNMYSFFDLNYENGDIYLVSQNSSTLMVKHNTSSFVNCLDTYNHSVDWKSQNAISTPAKVAKITTQTTAYKQPIEIISLAVLRENTFCIVLNDDLTDAPTFSYVLISITENNKTLLTGAYIKKADYQEISSTHEEQTAYILTNNTKVYKYPTAQKYSYIDENSNIAYSQLLLTTLSKGTEIVVNDTLGEYTDYIDENTDYIDEDLKYNELSFYQVEIDGKIGYILSNSVTFTQNTVNLTLKAPNAEINLPKEIKTISIFSDSSHNTQIAEIQNGTLVYYDISTELDGYVQIQYLSQSNQIVTGYVESKYVKSLGFSLYIILGIGLLILVLIISLIVVYINLRKKNQLKKH